MADQQVSDAAPVKKKQTKIIGRGIVKEVASGDSIVIMGLAEPGQLPPEKNITMSGILAPKFGRGKPNKDRNNADEPFAWDAREFLRQKIIGQQVSFVINYQHEDSQRCYGEVTFRGQNLAHALVANGLAKCKPNKYPDRPMPADREELFNIEAEAKRRNLNVHREEGTEGTIRNIDWAPNTRALYNSNKGKPILAIVDRVLEGSSLRLELLSTDNTLNHTMIILHLAGVVCPRTPLPYKYRLTQWENKKAANPNFKGEKPKNIPGDANAMGALHFVAARLLNRKVNVLLQGIDAFGNLFGTVLFHKGNITHRLLEKGFGQLQPWSAAITGEAQKLKHCETVARQAATGIWSEEAAKPLSNVDDVFEEYTAKVIGVNSGDSLKLLTNAGQEKKVFLASIRCGRLGGYGRPEEGFAMAAREAVRKRVIGKKVLVKREYVRGRDANNLNDYVTILQGDVNVAEDLCAKGLARCVMHRREEERSSQYERLLAAEATAKAANKNVHKFTAEIEKARSEALRRNRSPSDFPKVTKHIVDLTMRKPRKPKKEENEEKEAAPEEVEEGLDTTVVKSAAKAYEDTFKRSPQSAVVEHVFQAGRLKLYVPKHNCYISFALAGIRTPRVKKEDGSEDPVAIAANNYSRQLTHLDVMIETEVMDRGENFLGTVITPSKRSLAIDLLERGLAYVYEPSARFSPAKDQLEAAEAKAKDGRLGMWKDYDPEAERLAAEAKAAAKAAEMAEATATDSALTEHNSVDVNVTEITDAVSFFVQMEGDKNIETVLKEMSEFKPADEDEEWQANLKKGTLCACLFSDGTWHRVRYDGKIAGGLNRVFYLDYGNMEEVEASNLRPLPESLAKIKGLAHKCTLAALKAPGVNGAYNDTANMMFNDMVWNQKVRCTIECKDQAPPFALHVTLRENSEGDDEAKEPKLSINQQLLSEGLVRIDGRPERRINKSYIKSHLLPYQTMAQDNRKGQWEYGIVSTDEESEGDDRRR